MRRVVTFIHLLALVVFLGSIAVFILFTSQHFPPGSEAYAQLRAEVLLGTVRLTRPALLLTLASGIGLLVLQRRALAGWQLAKAGIGLLLMINTQVFVLPAIRTAAALAAPGTYSGSVAAALGAAVGTESVAGAVNLLLALAAAALAIWRPAFRSHVRRADAAADLPAHARPR